MPKSRFLIVSLALALLGCGDKNAPAPQTTSETKAAPVTQPAETVAPRPSAPEEKPPPAEVKAEPPPPAPVAWTDDVKGMIVPPTPLAGKVNGRPFVLDQTQLASVGVLTLRQGKDPAQLVEVQIPLPLKKYEVPAGRVYEVTPQGAPAVPVVSVRWKPDDKDYQSVDFGKDYLLRLEFGAAAGGKIAGRIYLALPDAAKSFLAGTFSADVEPDYSKPPRDDEAPYVAGKVALKGLDKYDVFVGVAGEQADGTAYTNGLGLEVTAGSDFALTSDSLAPQLTTLACDAEGSCVYRHVKLPPGRYLVHVRLGNRFLDGRWVEVKEGSRLTLDFSLDVATAGALEVTLPREAKGGVRLIPLDEAGKLPDLKAGLEPVGQALNTDVPAKDGKVLLDGLRPGVYRAIVGAAARDVTVKAKETVKVDLSAP